MELRLTLQWNAKLEVMQNKLPKGMFGTAADGRRSLPDGDTSQRAAHFS